MAAGGQPLILIGHEIVQVYPTPSHRWHLRCECGEEFRAFFQWSVGDHMGVHELWLAHRDEEAENEART